MLNKASASLEATIETLRAFGESGLAQAVQAAEALAQALAAGKKVLVFGNGGSAADAQHLAAELVNRFLLERPALPAVALTTDTSVLTSIANDYHFDEVFARQVKGLGNKGDVAIGISTSGRSPNVIKGLAAARSREMFTIGLTGRQGGEMASLCDVVINAPSDHTPNIQEVHIFCLHLICELVDFKLFGQPV